MKYIHKFIYIYIYIKYIYMYKEERGVEQVEVVEGLAAASL